ncbi:hypothetical protein ACVWZA_003996 [Sphingomonas sp. UYAg733]
MLNQRMTAAQSVAEAFRPAEEAIDHAAMLATRCLATMMEARALSGVPIATGLDELGRMHALSSRLIEARRDVISLHPDLAAVRDAAGLRAWFGDSDECSPIDRPKGEGLHAIA